MKDPKDISRREFLGNAGRLSALAAGGLAAPRLFSSRSGLTRSLTEAASRKGSSVHGKVLTQFPTLDNVYWQGMNAGAKAAGKALGLGYTEYNYNNSIDGELGSVQSAKSLGVTDILMFAQNAAGSVELIKAAANEGIHVVNYITVAPWSVPPEPEYKGYYTALLSTHEVLDAGAMCEAVFRMIGGYGKIINVCGIPGNPCAVGRIAGCDAALAKFPNIEMVAREDGGENRVATAPVIEALLTLYPDVKAVVVHNDDSAIGVLNALKARGMKDVVVGGNDADEEYLEAMIAGPNAKVTVAINGQWLGGYSVVRLFDAVQGVKFNPVETMQYHNAILIDSNASAEAYIKLIYKASKLPFDFAGMSQYLHPKSWNPEVVLAPINPTDLFKTYQYPVPSSSSWLPAAYRRAIDGAAFAEQTDRYRAAVTSSPFSGVVKLTKTKKWIF